jgi:hypothetical protein
MAGRWSAKAVLKNDLALLEEYDEEWRDLYGHSQDRAFSRRKRMETRWSEFESIIPTCWTAFREYYAEH